MKAARRFIVLVSIITLAACGGGGASEPGATFTKTVEQPGIDGDWMVLFTTTKARFQALVLAKDIGGAGPLRSVAVRVAAAAVANTCPDVTITVGHSSKTSLGTTFAINLMTDVTTVFSGGVAVPAGHRRSDWVEIPLSTPFAYNGEDNLVVQIAGPGASDDNTCLLDTTSTTRYAGRRRFGSQPAGTGWV